MVSTIIVNTCACKVYILVLLISLLKINNVETIRCYVCNSHHEPKCADKTPPPEMERNCTTENTNMTYTDNKNNTDNTDHMNNTSETKNITYTLCRKIDQTINYGLYNLKPDFRVIRTCGWDSSKYNETCYYASENRLFQHVCSCTTDLCNSGVALRALGGLVAALGLALGRPL